MKLNKFISLLMGTLLILNVKCALKKENSKNENKKQVVVAEEARSSTAGQAYYTPSPLLRTQAETSVTPTVTYLSRPIITSSVPSVTHVSTPGVSYTYTSPPPVYPPGHKPNTSWPITTSSTGEFMSGGKLFQAAPGSSIPYGTGYSMGPSRPIRMK